MHELLQKNSIQFYDDQLEDFVMHLHDELLQLAN